MGGPVCVAAFCVRAPASGPEVGDVRLGLTRLARFHLGALLVGRCGSLSSLLHSTDMPRLGVTTLAGSIWGNKKAALV